MHNLETVGLEASRTCVKKNKVKILQNTEALFEKLCYLTKVSLKAGEGTKILIDVSDLANCLGVSERTIRDHLKILCEFGVINRIDARHIYELSDLVSGDIMQKKRHKFLRIYLKANVNAEKGVDNGLVFPFYREEISTSHMGPKINLTSLAREFFQKRGMRIIIVRRVRRCRIWIV